MTQSLNFVGIISLNVVYCKKIVVNCLEKRSRNVKKIFA
jgi:hypothetical protein